MSLSFFGQLFMFLLSGKLLKATAHEMAPVLQVIFQRSIDESTLPKAWKETTISPVYKKECRSNPANYCPVSLTCILCKILEHTINRHILDHLDEHRILVDAQHGFRKRRSCETQLILTCHDLAKVVNDSGQVDMLVLDFAKAFDTVAHKRLLGKLESYGIDGNLYGWIQSFLGGRTQRVVVDGETLGPASVKSGVPQGSVLGPLLFLIFINDLAEHTTSTVRLFADDCVMYKSVKSVRDCQDLQQDLIQLQAWQERWQLRFNPRKCNVMRATHATRKKIEFPYTLDDTPLADTPSTSYLGVELSSDLRWDKQVKKTMAKGNQTLGVLKRNLRHCPRSIKDMAYKTILWPKLEYASAVWDPFTEDNIRKLEAVQRRAARFVCNSYRQTASVSSMLSELSWPLLEQRRAEARLGLFHRIVHKSVDIDAATLMTRSTRPTRKANEVQYTRHMTSKDCYKFSFIPRTIIQWNGIAATGDFNQYKSDLKSHDLTLSGPSYKLLLSAPAARMLLKERCSLLLQIQANFYSPLAATVEISLICLFQSSYCSLLDCRALHLKVGIFAILN